MSQNILLILILMIGLYIIIDIIYFYRKHKRKPKILLTLEFDNNKIKGEILMIGLKVEQNVKVKLQPMDRLGNPATVEPGSVQFESSDPDVFTVIQSPDNELEATVFSSLDNPGTAQLDYSADADLGEGVVKISGFSAVEVLPLQAVGFGLNVGEPEDV